MPLPVRHLYHDDRTRIIMDFVNYAIHTLTDSIPRLAGQFLAGLQPGILCQGIKPFQDPSDIFFRNSAKILADGFLEG